VKEEVGAATLNSGSDDLTDPRKDLWPRTLGREIRDWGRGNQTCQWHILWLGSRTAFECAFRQMSCTCCLRIWRGTVADDANQCMRVSSALEAGSV